MSKLKIFVTYKFKKPTFQNDIVTPIQTGRAIADEIFDDMIGDDTGDNISKDNPRYNELTAQYWVWKNYEAVGNPEYIGFMHYRRQFIFDKNLKHLPITWLPNSKFYFIDSMEENYIRHFTPEIIEPYLADKPDCIAFQRVNITPISHAANMKKHFYKGLPAQKLEVFEVFENVLKTHFPQYKNSFEEFKNGNIMFCCNCFVMPKKLFFEYNKFLFGVLEKVDENVDSSKFTTRELRFLGFLGEYLLSIFILHNLKNPGFKLKETAGTYICKDYKEIPWKMNRARFLAKFTVGKKKIHYIRKYLRYKHHYSD